MLSNHRDLDLLQKLKPIQQNTMFTYEFLLLKFNHKNLVMYKCIGRFQSKSLLVQ